MSSEVGGHELLPREHRPTAAPPTPEPYVDASALGGRGSLSYGASACAECEAGPAPDEDAAGRATKPTPVTFACAAPLRPRRRDGFWWWLLAPLLLLVFLALLLSNCPASTSESSCAAPRPSVGPAAQPPCWASSWSEASTPTPLLVAASPTLTMTPSFRF